MYVSMKLNRYILNWEQNKNKVSRCSQSVEKYTPWSVSDSCRDISGTHIGQYLPHVEISRFNSLPLHTLAGKEKSGLGWSDSKKVNGHLGDFSGSRPF